MDHHDHCAALVRQGDRDRYISDLFAPRPARGHLFALHAFNLEILAVGGRVSEAMAGEIRLQWWRDALEGRAEGVAAHPVAAALLAAIGERGLPADDLAALIDAHLFELYDEPMPSLAGLEAYGRATDGTLGFLAGLVLSDEPPETLRSAADRAGMAMTLTRLLAALPTPASLPFVPVDVARRNGLDLDAATAEPVAAVIAEIASAARRHLGLAEAALAELPVALRPAFLPLALTAPTLMRATAPGRDPMQPSRPLGPLRRFHRLWRAARVRSRTGL